MHLPGILTHRSLSTPSPQLHRRGHLIVQSLLPFSNSLPMSTQSMLFSHKALARRPSKRGRTERKSFENPSARTHSPRATECSLCSGELYFIQRQGTQPESVQGILGLPAETGRDKRKKISPHLTEEKNAGPASKETASGEDGDQAMPVSWLGPPSSCQGPLPVGQP